MTSLLIFLLNKWHRCWYLCVKKKLLEVWVYVGIVHISTGHLGILMILFFIATGTHTLDIIKWSLIEVVGSRCKELKTQRALFDFKRRHFTIGVCWKHGSGVRRRPRFYKIPILPIVTIIFFFKIIYWVRIDHRWRMTLNIIRFAVFDTPYWKLKV